MSVAIVDTATGVSKSVFSDRRQVRGFKWSPDGRRLAFFVLTDGVFTPVLYDRLSAVVQPIRLPPGKQAAENADFEWTRDGSEVLFAVRAVGWREEARKRFEDETAASVIVHSSADPFLAWDDVRRMASAARSRRARRANEHESRRVAGTARQLVQASRRRVDVHLCRGRDPEDGLRRDLRRRQRAQGDAAFGRRGADVSQIDQGAHARLVARRPRVRLFEGREDLQRFHRQR